MTDDIEARLRTHGRYGLAWEAADHIAQLEAGRAIEREMLRNAAARIERLEAERDIWRREAIESQAQVHAAAMLAVKGSST